MNIRGGANQNNNGYQSYGSNNTRSNKEKKDDANHLEELNRLMRADQEAKKKRLTKKKNAGAKGRRRGKRCTSKKLGNCKKRISRRPRRRTRRRLRK